MAVYPVHNLVFKVDISDTSTPELVTIADMESFELSLDNGIEEWTPMEMEGWVRRLMTAKSLSITASGKRNQGDPGNDFIAGLAFENGTNAQADIEIAFKDGVTLSLTNAVINVTEFQGGASTDVAPLSFEILSNGKPTITVTP